MTRQLWTVFRCDGTTVSARCHIYTNPWRHDASARRNATDRGWILGPDAVLCPHCAKEQA